MDTSLNSKRVLVTGACGTVGKQLVAEILDSYSVSELIAIDNNESELFLLEQQYSDRQEAHFFLGDIRDRDKLCSIMRKIDVVFHTAAYKHVIACERSPFEAVRTNVIGVQNIINSAIENQVEKVIFTSSDKAVNPTNVMGTTKLMGERLITAANCNAHSRGVIFASTRFGNVMGSRGSVIPIFREQIRQGGPVTLTDQKMTRFIMSIRDSAQLVINSSYYACGGEVFITKMPVIRIEDLAEVMIMELAPEYGFHPGEIVIEVIGKKTGEKMYEELMTWEETNSAIELEEYFVVTPAFDGLYRKIEYKYEGIANDSVSNPYNSSNEKPLSKDDLADFLWENKLLFEAGDEMRAAAEKRWTDKKSSARASGSKFLHLPISGNA